MTQNSNSRAPRVTALIDTFNQGRFIEEAIESVRAQDFPADEMEILIVDDGSTDDTAERVRTIGPRVRYVRKENGGQASALNLGFKLAQGEIVAMLDADDVWLPAKLRHVCEAFEKNPEAGLVYHPCQWWDIRTGRCEDDRSFTAISGYVPDSLADLLRFGGTGTWGMSLRKHVARKLLPIPETLIILADAYLLYTAIFAAPVAAIPKCLTRYRIHGENFFTFDGTDRQRARRRSACSLAAAEGARDWLLRNGYDTRQARVAAFLEREFLVADMVRFMGEPPGRREFFRYLWAFQRVHRPLWSAPYAAYRRALAAAGFLLGYETFQRWQDAYRASSASQKLRGALFPAGAAHNPASAE